MQSDPVKISYRLTSGDYAAMTKVLSRRPLIKTLQTIALWLLSVWCLTVYFSGTYNPAPLISAVFSVKIYAWIAIAVLALVLATTIFSHWFAWAISFIYYRQIASAGATITIILRDNGIEGRSDVADTFVPWASVKRHVVADERLILPISKREALIMPRRAFSSDSEFDAARNFAATRISQTGRSGTV